MSDGLVQSHSLGRSLCEKGGPIYLVPFEVPKEIVRKPHLHRGSALVFKVGADHFVA